MSFLEGMKKIEENLEKTFEKNFEKAVNNPDDGTQADKDSRQAGQDTSGTAGDTANDEVKNHEPAWKAVKDLSDTAIAAETKVVAATKVGFFKFVGVVTAIFAGAMAISFSQRQTGPTPDQIRMQNTLRTIEIQDQQIKQMERIMVSNDEFNIATANLFAAPAPVIDDPVAPAAAALPPPIAAVAAQPVQVVETDSSGEVEAVTTTTVGHAYQSIPREAQRQMENNPPPKIEHDYDKPSTKDCFRDDCLGAIDKQFGQKTASFTSGDGSMSITVNSPTR